ncbi:MAG: hypothetical protein LE180_05935 [Endomicrobium sp.]|uniref:hypothetical protein n=1 Tax=Candidatus Endomicrobiellum pyrsonymphae TaxID=1408203 RepID=UPI00357293CB|nr:hypothetical protein [Endomicrobium sp.]
MMTLLLKRRHNTMTLQLKRCVSLFVCLSLLVSACSPDNSSKAGGKVSSDVSSLTSRRNNNETLTTPSFCDRHKSCSWVRDKWHHVRNDEIKIGGVSTTPMVATLVGVGTVAALFVVWYKWYTRKQFRSVGSNTEITQYYDEPDAIIPLHESSSSLSFSSSSTSVAALTSSSAGDFVFNGIKVRESKDDIILFRGNIEDEDEDGKLVSIAPTPPNMYYVPRLAKTAGFEERERDSRPRQPPTRKKIMNDLKEARRNAEEARKILNENKKGEPWVEKLRKPVTKTEEMAKRVKEVFGENKRMDAGKARSMMDRAVEFEGSAKEAADVCVANSEPDEPKILVVSRHGTAAELGEDSESKERVKNNKLVDKKMAATWELEEATANTLMSSVVLKNDLKRHYDYNENNYKDQAVGD